MAEVETKDKVLYTAEAHVTGGRAQGHGRTSDGALEVDIRVPTELGGDGGGTNPEQLFPVGHGSRHGRRVGPRRRSGLPLLQRHPRQHRPEADRKRGSGGWRRSLTPNSLSEEDLGQLDAVSATARTRRRSEPARSRWSGWEYSRNSRCSALRGRSCEPHDSALLPLGPSPPHLRLAGLQRWDATEVRNGRCVRDPRGCRHAWEPGANAGRGARTEAGRACRVPQCGRPDGSRVRGAESQAPLEDSLTRLGLLLQLDHPGSCASVGRRGTLLPLKNERCWALGVTSSGTHTRSLGIPL